MAERAKGNLPVCTVYNEVLGLHGLDSQTWVSLSCPSNLRAINGKLSSEENIDITSYCRCSMSSFCESAVLHFVKTISFSVCIVSQSFFCHGHTCQFQDKMNGSQDKIIRF